MNGAVVKKTQDTLGKVIKKPPLTEKLLNKPPFRYLHDILSEVIRTTGFLKGLYTDAEMKSDNVKEKDSKIQFLQKAIDVVMLVSGESVSAKPPRIVAGHEPERTNELLQAIGKCCLNKLNSDEAVKRVLSGEKVDLKGKPSSTSKSQDKENREGREQREERKEIKEEGQTRAPSKDPEQPPRDQEGSRRTDKDKDKDREREKDRERHRDGDRQEKGGRERDRTKDRDKDKSRDRGGQRERERERERKDRERERRDRERDRREEKERNDKEREREREAKARERGDVPKERDRERDRERHGDKDRQRRRDRDDRDQQRDRERHKDGEKPREQGERKAKPAEEPRPKAHPEEPSKNHKPENTESPARIPRPSSAKGQRRWPKAGGPDESDSEGAPPAEKPVQLENGDATDAAAPAQLSHRRIPRPNSARPAPPRVKRQESYTEGPPAERLGSAAKPIMAGVIVEGKKLSEDEEEDDEHFVVEEAAPVPADLADVQAEASVELQGDENHGGLVKKILETKKDFETTPSSPKANQERTLVSEAARRKERELVAREIERLRSSIQTVCRSSLPLGKIMDYIQEDVDAMQAELQGWRRENKEHAQALLHEQRVTDGAVEPLQAELSELDQLIRDQQDKICAVKSSILRNEEKIQKMVQSINFSSQT
ncbi:TRAF3-interacting protein 1 isoform X2 [Engraulis encrasicolus]|uniref:TRAF3-interacting protein 1 isoform X2 n=1 Tax=Engraulis encrasicolus TaxID=184585 RepID=UPI002FD69723